MSNIYWPLANFQHLTNHFQLLLLELADIGMPKVQAVICTHCQANPATPQESLIKDGGKECPRFPCRHVCFAAWCFLLNCNKFSIKIQLIAIMTWELSFSEITGDMSGSKNNRCVCHGVSTAATHLVINQSTTTKPFSVHKCTLRRISVACVLVAVI